jgi:hypothetical protein
MQEVHPELLFHLISLLDLKILNTMTFHNLNLNSHSSFVKDFIFFDGIDT